MPIGADEEERAHYYEEGEECVYCEYMSEGCQCDAAIYANTYVEMRCECGPCAVGDHEEKYVAYQRLERSLRAAAARVKRPKSARKRAHSDGVDGGGACEGKRARAGSHG